MTKEERPRKDAGERRKARLAEALRANLQKRKAQMRSRRSGAADTRPEGLAGAHGRSED
jgi:hypothetical protein